MSAGNLILARLTNRVKKCGFIRRKPQYLNSLQKYISVDYDWIYQVITGFQLRVWTRGIIFHTNDNTIIIHNLLQEIFFSIVNNKGLVENAAKIIIYSIYFSPCYMYSGKIVHLPMISMTESSLMDLEKYEHNFHFSSIFSFWPKPLYNRTLF